MASGAILYPPVPGGEWTYSITNDPGENCMIVVTPTPGLKPTVRCVKTGCPHDCNHVITPTYDPPGDPTGTLVSEAHDCFCQGS